MSKTILGRAGAEQLPDVPGRMLALVEGQSREPVELQGYYLDDEAVKTVTASLAEREYSPLTELEQDLVLYAMDELDGAFNIDRLADRFEGRISRNRLKRLARAWERRGWLTPAQVGVSRQVTDTLRALLGTGDAPGS